MLASITKKCGIIDHDAVVTKNSDCSITSGSITVSYQWGTFELGMTHYDKELSLIINWPSTWEDIEITDPSL